MQIAALPLKSLGLNEFVRYEKGHFTVWGSEGSVRYLFGDREVAAKTVAMFERVIEIYEEGARDGHAPAEYGVFYIEPGEHISLWVMLGNGFDCRVYLSPKWLREMRPVFAAGIQHAIERPLETQVFIPDEQRGWRYGRLCDD